MHHDAFLTSTCRALYLGCLLLFRSLKHIFKPRVNGVSDSKCTACTTKTAWKTEKGSQQFIKSCKKYLNYICFIIQGYHFLTYNSPHECWYNRWRGQVSQRSTSTVRLTLSYLFGSIQRKCVSHSCFLSVPGEKMKEPPTLSSSPSISAWCEQQCCVVIICIVIMPFNQSVPDWAISEGPQNEVHPQMNSVFIDKPSLLLVVSPRPPPFMWPFRAIWKFKLVLHQS